MPHENTPSQTGVREPYRDTVTTLRDKYDTYLRLVATQQDADGFVHAERCDSLLWGGLLAAAGCTVNLTAARLPSGQWLRRPTSYPECYACGGSKSSISRDMLLGVLWGAWRTKNAGLLLELLRYARSNYWVMGSGTPTRTLFSPALASTAAHAVAVLGGPRLWERRLPAYLSSKVTGYQAHLQVLHLLLRRELGLRVPEGHLRWHAEREPNNPLFQAAAGNLDAAERLLLNAQWWPDDRLPTSADRAEEWLTQRDYGEDWAPGEAGTTFSGGDFLFVAKLILDRHSHPWDS